jgi:hypothetical protein
MIAPSQNMPIAMAVPRSKPLLLRHLPYFIGAAILVTLAATMRFDGYIHNILMQAVTFAIAVFGLSVVLGLCGQSASAPPTITSATGSALPAVASSRCWPARCWGCRRCGSAAIIWRW